MRDFSENGITSFFQRFLKGDNMVFWTFEQREGANRKSA